MVRPNLDDIPDFPLPDEIEVRPVHPDHYRRIWEADTEAFRDHWGFSEPTEEDYVSWLDDKVIFQPELWQIAWDMETDEIAGQVRTFIHHGENEKFSRKRGYTEFISVRRPRRRRGLARALIALSLKAQQAAGMVESALGVDSENLSGATRIYEECGFRVVRKSTIYRKPLPPATSTL
jgi:ribosomal protein S18 acetylase RimI-like enzyme